MTAHAYKYDNNDRISNSGKYINDYVVDDDDGDDDDDDDDDDDKQLTFAKGEGHYLWYPILRRLMNFIFTLF